MTRLPAETFGRFYGIKKAPKPYGLRAKERSKTRKNQRGLF